MLPVYNMDCTIQLASGGTVWENVQGDFLGDIWGEMSRSPCRITSPCM